MKLTERQILAANAARELFDLLPPQDLQHPKKVMAAVVETFSNYHQSVITAAPLAIAKRLKRLNLKDVTDICDELQDVISRKFERDRAAQSHHLALAPPPKPDQTRRDEQAVDYETRVKPVLTSALGSIERARVERPADGRHFDRIKADLEARRHATRKSHHSRRTPPDRPVKTQPDDHHHQNLN